MYNGETETAASDRDMHNIDPIKLRMPCACTSACWLQILHRVDFKRLLITQVRYGNQLFPTTTWGFDRHLRTASYKWKTETHKVMIVDLCCAISNILCICIWQTHMLNYVDTLDGFSTKYNVLLGSQKTSYYMYWLKTPSLTWVLSEQTDGVCWHLSPNQKNGIYYSECGENLFEQQHNSGNRKNIPNVILCLGYNATPENALPLEIGWWDCHMLLLIYLWDDLNGTYPVLY